MAKDDVIPTGRMARASKLGAFGARAGVARAWLGLSSLGRSRADKAAREAAHHRAHARDLRAVLGQMRGVVTKLGQLASFVDTSFLPEGHGDVYRELLA